MEFTNDLTLKVWGCRGSIAARDKMTQFLPVGEAAKLEPFSTRFGINTTCFSLESKYLPENTVLFIDSGSGFFTASPYYYFAGYKKVILMQTHYHYDHTIGLTMALYTHIPDHDVEFYVYGPNDQSIGPRKAISHLMHRPVFPIEISEREVRFKKMVPLEQPRNTILACHKNFGIKALTLRQFHELSQSGKRFKMNKHSDWVYLNDCLIIKINDCLNHPQKTLSYRFEANGKSLTILTDHENTDGTHVELKPYLKGTQALVMDCQYTKKGEPRYAAGFGHATPDYCVKVAEEAGVKNLYLCHHAPSASDAMIENIEAEARSYAANGLAVDSLREGMHITL
ncbi:MAG: hypothetical protein HZC28_11855 [Spirochaetes bacterium]|nr:hypothetical protein [Spirochaetota bacterium]